MSWREFRRLLGRPPLGYRVERQAGSHRTMTSPEFPTIHLGFHESATLPPGLVRKILTRDVGLSEDQALELVRHR
jgi:predicted RNA binding protein YcfA (HicA-like mRNA interferase family)